MLLFSKEKILKATRGKKNIIDKKEKSKNDDRLLDRNEASQMTVEKQR